MGKFLAQFISVAFHPLFMPLYTLAIVFNSPIYIVYKLPLEAQYATYGVVALFTFVMPAASTLMLFKMEGLTNLQMTNQKERSLPYIMSAIFYGTAYFSLLHIGFPQLITNALLGATVALVILFALNHFKKISAHMVGVGGLLGVVYALSEIYLEGVSPYLIPAIIMAGLIAHSRLRLNAHQPLEIYIGLFVGFFSEYCLQWY